MQRPFRKERWNDEPSFPGRRVDRGKTVTSQRDRLSSVRVGRCLSAATREDCGRVASPEKVTASASSIRIVTDTGEAITGVGKYRCIALLAEGERADVSLAVTQNAGSEKLLVIKQLRDALADDDGFDELAWFGAPERNGAVTTPNLVGCFEAKSPKPRPQASLTITAPAPLKRSVLRSRRRVHPHSTTPPTPG